MKPSVLIVDRSEETREVLKTALERRGLEIHSASRAQQGLEMAKEHGPDLIVLDLETEIVSPEEIHGSYQRESRIRATPLIMLGTLRRQKGEMGTGEYVSKPYHYGPLIRRIEELLNVSRSEAAPTH